MNKKHHGGHHVPDGDGDPTEHAPEPVVQPSDDETPTGPVPDGETDDSHVVEPDVSGDVEDDTPAWDDPSKDGSA